MIEVIEVRCPQCNVLLCEASAGSTIEIVCRRCKNKILATPAPPRFVYDVRTHTPRPQALKDARKIEDGKIINGAALDNQTPDLKTPAIKPAVVTG